jgi:hypothetical protein
MEEGKRGGKERARAENTLTYPNSIILQLKGMYLIRSQFPDVNKKERAFALPVLRVQCVLDAVEDTEKVQTFEDALDDTDWDSDCDSDDDDS